MIGVKKNQRILHTQIKAILADNNNHSSWHTTIEVNKGRSELRNTMVSNCIEPINGDWKGLQQIIGVHRMVKDKGKNREEMAYFISSRNENAFFYLEGIRSHWEIENSLHYAKDVTQREDASRIRTGNAPQNISTLKNIAINLFRKNNYTSLAQGMRLVSNDISTLCKIIL